MYTIFCKIVGLCAGLWMLLCTTSNVPHFLKRHRVSDIKTLIILCTAFSVKWLGYVQGYGCYCVLQAMYRIF